VRVHFIAIGGSAMHNLALALSERGDAITGSDDEIFEPSRSRLAAAGILPESLGWDAARITPDLDAAVLGMHARGDNPELLAAQALGIPIHSYPAFLYEASKHKTRVVVAGSHGKTTVTSMLLHALKANGRTEDFMVGALLEGYSTMVRLSKEADFMVLEGDEYLSSALEPLPKFHLYRANIAVITGIAWDHINVFPTLDNYVEQFRQFLRTMEPGGVLIYNANDPLVAEVVAADASPLKKIPYTTPAYRMVAEAMVLETPLGDVPLQVIGAHNASNIEAARWLAQEMGLDDEAFYESMTTFRGASKRLEVLATASPRVKAFKDFAHAPSKVKATVSALREQFPDRRIVACLELHTFSSLNPDFLPLYDGALALADEAVVYFNPKAVAHKKLPPLKASDVAEAFGMPHPVVLTDSAEVRRFLDEATGAQHGAAAVVLMSSGNFDGNEVSQWAEAWG
jgi:UDP-N-acetylmuramate: L-alanyl-gamma-D-glutamyl-meso-diaminopimelate ligase